MKFVLKFATGEEVPENAEYLWSCKNGVMNGSYQYVWHYFLVSEEDYRKLEERK